jgi:glycosyltransferase involved in cell wall biosynthesis
MLITIITPSKNQGKFIGDCLRSIYGQTHRPIRHLILDGVSTDETASVAGLYPSEFLQQKDSGPAQAINRGLDMAAGEVICWLNADDAFFGPQVLSEVARIFTEHPEVDVLTGDGYYMDEGGRLIRPILPLDPARMTRKWLTRSDIFLQPATFWRRNALRLDETLHYAFDWQLWLDFYDAGLNVLYVRNYWALYRVQPESLTFQDSPLRRKEIFNIIRNYSGSRAQSCWCWMTWKAFELAKVTKSRLPVRCVAFLNYLLNRATDGRINWA